MQVLGGLLAWPAWYALLGLVFHDSGEIMETINY